MIWISNRSKLKKLLWRSAAVVFLLWILVETAPVWAIAEPDNLRILSSRCYGEAIDTGDILCVIHYDIAYASVPTQAASETFLGRYMDGGSVPLKTTAPFVLVSNGYNQGIMSVYFSPTDVTDLGVVYGDATDTLQIIGSPAVFGSPQSVSLNIEWISETDSQDDIELAVRNTAFLLEAQVEWAGTDLLIFEAGFTSAILTGTLAESSGEQYFSASIPNLRLMAPNLFSARIVAPSNVETVGSASYVTTLDDFFVGSKLEGSFDGLASELGLSVRMTKTLFVGLPLSFIVVTLVIVFLTKQEGITPEQISATSIIVLFLMMAATSKVGWMDFRVTAAIGGLSIFALGAVYFLKRAS